MDKTKCFCGEQKLYCDMLSVDEEDSDEEIFSVTCLACGRIEEISFEDYFNLELSDNAKTNLEISKKSTGTWYIKDEYYYTHYLNFKGDESWIIPSLTWSTREHS